jgi:hypothetical protein
MLVLGFGEQREGGTLLDLFWNIFWKSSGCEDFELLPLPALYPCIQESIQNIYHASDACLDSMKMTYTYYCI